MNFEEETGISAETGVVKKSRLVPIVLTIVAVLLFLASQAPELAKIGSSVFVNLFFGVDSSASSSTSDSNLFKEFVDGFGRFVFEQLRRDWVLVLYALIPGIAGLIYRRAFWPWFLLSAAILFAINSGNAAVDVAGDAAVDTTAGAAVEVSGPNRPFFKDVFYLFLESQLLLVLLATSLRRHVAVASERTVLRNVLFPLALVLIGLIGIVVAYTSGELHTQFLNLTWPNQFAVIVLFLEFEVFLFAVAYSFFRQRHEHESEPKNIVLCMDGTWNHPGQTDFGYLAQTNVFKLYSLLEGEPTRKNYNASLSKTCEDGQGNTKQVSLYFHGVGNPVENSAVGQAIGGAMGMGADAIVERAYLDVVRVYKPGDRIYIFGFSRGAAIARLVAAVIGRRQIPKSLWTLSLFGRHWSIWKSPKRFENVKIDVLGCWDTVGSFGISKNFMGIPFQKINLLKDLTIADCVKRAYHMVALDETRDAFEPTLMDSDPTDPARIVEVWFPGIHSNVGGGYATDGLSDLALSFLLEHVSSGYSPESDTTTGNDAWGLYLKKNHAHEIGPNAKGKLRYATGAMFDHEPREMPLPSIVHDSVFERMKDPACGYAPKSVFDLCDHLVLQQKFIEEEVGNLGKTEVFSQDEAMEVVQVSKQYLTLTKWSSWRAQLGDAINPRDEKELGRRNRPPGVAAQAAESA